MIYLRKYLLNFIHDKSAQQRLLLYFLIVLIFFGAFLKPDFATDTYAYAAGDFSEITYNFLRCGRIFTAGIYALLRCMHIPISVVNVACFIVAIASLTFALYILEKLLRQNFIKNRFWSFIIPILLLVNPFIIEYFLFIEKGIMCFCILLCVISASYYNKYLDQRHRPDLVKVLLLNIFATFWYQGVIGLFIILATVATVLKAKQWLPFVKDTLLSVGLYVIGPLLNVLVIKLFFADGRTSGGLHIIEAAKMTIGSLDRMFNIFGIFPSYIFWGYLAIIFIGWIIYSAMRHKLAFLPIIKTLYLAIVILLASVVPQLALDPASVWIAPRAVYPFATIIGVTLILIFYTSPRFLVTKPWQYVAVVATFCLIFAEYMGFNTIILDHYSIAEIDRLRAERIGQIINGYEQANNIEVKYIAPSYDADKTYSYTGIKTLPDSNISAFSTDWSDVTSISFWNQRSFIRQSPDSAWQEYCSSHSWSDFDTAQIKFTGDVMQICLY